MTCIPKVTIFNTPEELGKAAAELILAEYSRKGKLVLGVPWGTTPVPIFDAFAEIVKEREVNLSNFHMVMMDEYVQQLGKGYSFVDRKAAYSGHYHVNRDILQKLPPDRSAQLKANIHFPDPNNPERFENLIEKQLGGVDTFIVATGAHDGHVAMNWHGTPLQSKTKVLKLPETVREYNFQKMEEQFNNKMENVPRFGVSIGLSTILKAKKLLFVAFGASKAKIWQILLKAKRFDSKYPVTFLWEALEKTEFFVDQETAKEK